MPLRRTDNTDIVQCEHSFRPDGMIFQSSTPLFLHSRRWSLTPAFHLQELLPDEELLVRIKIAVYLLARSFIMLLHELAPIMEVEQFD